MERGEARGSGRRALAAVLAGVLAVPLLVLAGHGLLLALDDRVDGRPCSYELDPGSGPAGNDGVVTSRLLPLPGRWCEAPGEAGQVTGPSVDLGVIGLAVLVAGACVVLVVRADGRRAAPAATGG